MDSKEFSDPCQVPVRDKVTGTLGICGVIKPSLSAHLKAHNKKGGGKKWNSDRYRKEFPSYSLGKPMYSPPPEQQEKFHQARLKSQEDKRVADGILTGPPPPKPKPEKLNFEGGGDNKVISDEYKENVQQRFEELWDQVNRDLPARQFAMEASRSEQRIEEINRRYDSAFARGDYKRMEALMKELQLQQKILKDCMDFLDLTVKNRRDKNQLGDDTVSQLVSNYGRTLRSFSPEKTQAFNNRVNEVRRIMEETRRQKLLSEILEEQINEIEPQKQMSEQDYDEQIQEIVNRAGSL